MSIHFTKMHALGNDFMVIDAISQKISITRDNIIAWSKRDCGIGFDQCLLVEPSPYPDIDFFYRIFNANGSEVGQCGNGARCLARFIYAKKLTQKTEIYVATTTTTMKLCLHEDNTVTVDMGKIITKPSKIPLNAATEAKDYMLTTKPPCRVHALSIGNPHAILHVADLTTTPVATLGKAISENTLFPEQTNVGFMQIINSSHIKLRVYERGCGETQACGSAAVAAVAIGQLYYRLNTSVAVQMPGGSLAVSADPITGSMKLRGSANFVYEGCLYLLESA